MKFSYEKSRNKIEIKILILELEELEFPKKYIDKIIADMFYGPYYIYY